VSLSFADLATAPPSNSYLTAKQLNEPEKWYPLRVMVCESCWLVQTEDFVFAEDMFSHDYAYFSSTSSDWVRHARRYVDEVSARFKLNRSSLAVEIAANDGYLLQFFKARGVPCLGIEPTASTASAARAKGIETIVAFFEQRLQIELRGTQIVLKFNRRTPGVPVRAASVYDVIDGSAGL